MYLLLYDITENALRAKVAKLLEHEGYERLQFSVFVGSVNPKHFGIWDKLSNILHDTPNNKLYCLKISKENFYRIKTIGNFELDLEYLSGDKSSLII